MWRQSMQTKCTAPSRETAAQAPSVSVRKVAELGLGHLARGHGELAVPALGIGVAVDLDVVGRIEEGRIDTLISSPITPAGSPDRGRRRSRSGGRPVARCRRPGSRGVTGTAGITSSSGSALPLRITSISPVEKPVMERSKSRSSVPSSASSSFRISMSQPAPSAILLSASRSARFCGLGQTGQRDRRHRGHLKRLGRQEPAVAGNDHPGLVDQDRIGKAKALDRGRDLLDLPLGMGAGIARIGLQRGRARGRSRQALRRSPKTWQARLTRVVLLVWSHGPARRPRLMECCQRDRDLRQNSPGDTPGIKIMGRG